MTMLACGGQVGGSYALGAVGDASFDPQSTIVSYFPCPARTDFATNQTTGPRSLAVVVLTESPNTCALARDGGVDDAAVPGLILIMTGDVSSPNALLAPGSYPASIYGSPSAAFAASLASPLQYRGTVSGSITLDSVTPAAATGSFDLSFGAQGSLRGGFQASECNVSDPGAVGATMEDCLR
jgi:hypothetical protein